MTGTATTERLAHLDGEWLRGRVGALAAIDRPSASPGEREAAEWLVSELEAIGVEATLESEPAHGTYWWPLGIAAAAGAIAGAATLRGHRVLGAALAIAAGGAAADDLPPGGRRRLRSLLPRGQRTQVLAELGPADAERTIVVSAHHDAAHCGLIFSPEIPERLERAFPGLLSEVFDTSPPLLGAPVATIPALIGLGALTGSRRLTKAGAVAALGGLAALADIGLRGVSPGANDNATGVAALLAVARALVERPPERVRVLLLSTSEEALCDGMQAFCERHLPGLPRETTFFLCLDVLGSPHLCVLRGEGMLGVKEYPPEALALLDGLADELGIGLFPNLRLRNATDGIYPLVAGYPCAALCSCTKLKQPANYHWETDVPENVDYGTLADAIRLAEAAVRRLDERWLSGTGAGEV